jgi:glucosamine-6-phosphate deaminase
MTTGNKETKKKTGRTPSKQKTKASKQPVPTSRIEKIALEKSGYDFLYTPEEKIPSIIVDNFPALGKLTAVRFLEWVQHNPEGVISLPTGKTPEHFIKYIQHFLTNWNKKQVKSTLEQMGLDTSHKPDLSGLNFVQIDEFYPIDIKQHNSFNYYVHKFYIKGFGLDPAKCLLIDPTRIGIPKGKKIDDVFPEGTVDLRLRIRRARSLQEKIQQRVLAEVDAFCTHYERQIRKMGGLGFFLGGIGPDGHIGFNVRGSDLFCTTRLTEPNYETRAAAATDLGGIEVARNKHVITIGLSTITHNNDCTALIIAAGEAKAKIVADTIHSCPSNKYPGSVLSFLPNARFFLTHGASTKLTNRVYVDFERKEEIKQEDINRVVMNLSINNNKPIAQLTNDDFKKDRFGNLLLKKVTETPDALKKKTESQILDFLRMGNAPVENKTYLHTAPHHDDIILGYLPYFTNLRRASSNKHYFAYMTSGFNAVTNSYMEGIIEDLLERLEKGEFRDLLKKGYLELGNGSSKSWDTSLYLKGEARHHDVKKDEATARRLLRNLIELFEDDDIENLQQRVRELRNYFKTQYPGKKDIQIVQQLKGRVREWESDLKWAYYGFTGDKVRHLRLGFYKGDIFTETPTVERDIPPILSLLHEVNPDVVTVAFDPEGSGPDTHYKVLQATSSALQMYEKESGRSDVRVLGYRNVWFVFHPSEANLYVPTSLRHLNDMEHCFDICFSTQRSASFPSHQYDGPFSKLARKIQVKQFEAVKAFLGEEFFVESEDNSLRACCGMVFLKEMSLNEFYGKSAELKAMAEEA